MFGGAVGTQADRALLALADRQGSVIAAAQAHAHGLSGSAIGRRLASGEWRRVHRATYRVTALRLERATAVWAAHLAVAGSAVTSAGALWRVGVLSEPPAVPHLAVPTAWRGAAPAGHGSPGRVCRSARRRSSAGCGPFGARARWCTSLPVDPSTDPRCWTDLAFPGCRLAVEVDGWAWHIDPDRFQRDPARQNALVLAGWTVLRFTWSDVTERPDRVVAQIRRALE